MLANRSQNFSGKASDGSSDSACSVSSLVATNMKSQNRLDVKFDVGVATAKATQYFQLLFQARHLDLSRVCVCVCSILWWQSTCVETEGPRFNTPHLQPQVQLAEMEMTPLLPR